ncbi:penicillin-binding transpeptidase domain-containing protein [Fictibacillus iocasae]|uniref:Penicillin-binding transpeptidase domain-containing protein n=1 Tax=Fictibacillus iocasae TaxID=2715437 RepID=A0ABW2NQL9_9BACL
MNIRFIAAGFIMLAIVALSGCSEPPKPDKAMKTYISHWEKQEFEKMYNMLSAESKQSIQKEEFVRRYEAIYAGIEADKLNITAKKSSKEIDGDKTGVNYDLKMNTLAGPVEYTHKMNMVLEEKNDSEQWAMEWNASHIFPQMKEGDKVSATTLPAKRGAILDKNGAPLAVNGTAHEIVIVPKELGANKEETITKLAPILGLSIEDIQAKLEQKWVKPEHSVPIKKLAIDDPNAKKAVALPGVKTQKNETRIYPLKEAAAHLTGYIRPIDAEELKTLKKKGYTDQDWLGKAGLEQVYEEQLRGKSGGVIKILDKNGEEKEVVAQTPVKNGADVKTTIDSATQQSIFNSMKGDAGTASAIHPLTGEILAMVNSPSYDPNDFILGMKQSQFDALQKNPKQPFLNRFKHTYAPGSTLKPLTAAIGLENGVIDPDKALTIKGAWKKDASWGNYAVNRVTEVPSVNLRTAMIYSDNIYFAQHAVKLGKEKYLTGLQEFGFEKELSIQFPITKSTYGESDMSEVQLADSSYGQGKVQMSPLHLALSYTPFVNKGSLASPKLVSSDKGEPASVISPETAARINEDLKQVVANKKGTAHDSYMADLPLAAKTGTAELKRKADEKGAEYGWYVAYNADNPSLLVAMMIEDVQDRNGSHYLAPKVKQIFKNHKAKAKQ